MTLWTTLDHEIQQWCDAGLTPTLWWRDDDAAQWVPALDRLVRLSQDHAVPLGVALIPRDVTTETMENLAAVPTVYGLQHGYDHQNYAPETVKKCELGADRDLATVLASLSAGYLALGRFAFVHPVLVPPWNRIAPSVVERLSAVGLKGLSTFKPRHTAEVEGVRVINTHVDLIDWKQTRGFVGADVALQGIIDHLRDRRIGKVDSAEPTGVLTHHLVHDQALWTFLERLFKTKGLEWINPFHQIGLDD